jgi:acyl-CoA synthetase (AMP-forming)/AMP-acid ligase II
VQNRSVLTVDSVIESAARVAPDHVAATDAAGRMTFAELDRSSDRVAYALAARGVTLGDRVAWWSDTSLAALAVFGACAKTGAVFMPLNARAGVAELSSVLAYARADLLVAGRSHLPDAAALGDATGVQCVGADELLDNTIRTDRAWLGSRPRPSDPHVIFFTSGSTGRPKGVVLSHRTSWLRSYPGATSEAEVGGGVVCMFPLFHMAGFSIALGAWQQRRAVHFAPADARTLLAVAEAQRAGRMYCIPAVWARILDHGVGDYDLSSLREADTGTSATPPELLRAIKVALPHTVTRVFYGSTEAGPASLLADADLDRKPGSVGRPQPGCEIRLVEGEVCIRNPFLMDGYFDAPGATAAALRDGWYHTGDLGVIDDEGYLSIVGRARDVIRTGGETVSPLEVEAALAGHPAIREVAVVGVPDATWGELVTAVVVSAHDDPPTIADLRAHLDGRLAPFKHPRRVAVVDALPRTGATGQIQRTMIVERLVAGSAG